MSFQKEFEQLSQLENISTETTAIMPNGQGAKEIFCQGWPAAKTVLEAISAMIKNAGLKIAIGIVIKLGEGFYTGHCNIR